MKTAQHLNRVAPELFAHRKPGAGYGSVVPHAVLAELHETQGRLPKSVRAKVGAGVAASLKRARVPRPGTKALAPLFNGTAYFVRVTFTAGRNKSVFAVSRADVATAIRYAALAAKPISRYARQYGPNGLRISPRILELAVTLPSTKYNGDQLKDFVNQVVAQNRLPRTAAVVVLNPEGMINTDGPPTTFFGYHDLADRPFSFVNVGRSTSGFTIADAGNNYALGVSHELAEMVVDPLVNNRNPEVCDACAANCGPEFRNYFKKKTAAAAPSYLQSLADVFPPPFKYDFFIAGIVQRGSAAKCPADAAACNYAPPAR